MQREEPVAAGGLTHGKRHQADVRFGCRRRPERQLYELQLTPCCAVVVSLPQRLHPRRPSSQYRPTTAIRHPPSDGRSASKATVARLDKSYPRRHAGCLVWQGLSGQLLWIATGLPASRSTEVLPSAQLKVCDLVQVAVGSQTNGSVAIPYSRPVH